jgi:hypothetical protein
MMCVLAVSAEADFAYFLFSIMKLAKLWFDVK